jgi:hypothetical protein
MKKLFIALRRNGRGRILRSQADGTPDVHFVTRWSPDRLWSSKVAQSCGRAYRALIRITQDEYVRPNAL